MDKYDLILEVQKIINRYDSLPHNQTFKESLLEEICNFIGNNVNSLEDIKFVTSKLDLNKWENENVNR